MRAAPKVPESGSPIYRMQSVKQAPPHLINHQPAIEQSGPADDTFWEHSCEAGKGSHRILPAALGHCRDAPVPRDKMIRPEDIAQAALLPFRMSPLACPTDIVVRPSHKLSPSGGD